MRSFFLALALAIPTTSAAATYLEDGATLLAANALCNSGFSAEAMAELISASSTETGIRNLQTITKMMQDRSVVMMETMLKDQTIVTFCANIDAFIANQKRMTNLKTY